MQRADANQPCFDPPTALTCLKGWAGRFYDDSSPAKVTDVLVVFAFVVGVEMASAHPDEAAALLQHVRVTMPSAGAEASRVASTLVEPRAPDILSSARYCRIAS